ncbi:MAG: antitoxin [Myxococcales bacterium]|nr:MAG: antitoxin [Myxococcales bacterium]
MTTTKLFLSNTTQAVRLPKAVAFPDDVTEVEIVVEGETRVLVPVGRRIDYFFDHRLDVSEDFMTDREQPRAQERSGL